jgi:hypothetical protein
MAHDVTITRLPNEESDDWEYTFGGTHGHDCTVLMPCTLRRCQGLKREYYYGDERTAHGVAHEYRDGEWLVESDQCALRYVFESVTEGETFEGIELGTYPVRIDWDDDSWWVEVQRAVHANGAEK